MCDQLMVSPAVDENVSPQAVTQADDDDAGKRMWSDPFHLAISAKLVMKLATLLLRLPTPDIRGWPRFDWRSADLLPTASAGVIVASSAMHHCT